MSRGPVSLKRFFQRLAWAKLWDLGGLYFNRRAGARISTVAGLPLADGKGAKVSSWQSIERRFELKRVVEMHRGCLAQLVERRPYKA